MWKINKTASAIISCLPVVSLLALVATLLFPFSPIQRGAIYAFVLTYFVDYFYHQRYKQWQWKNSMWTSIVSMLLFAWLLIVHLALDDGFSERYSLLVNCLAPFLLLGLLGLLALNERFAISHFAWVMLLMVVGEGAYVAYHVGAANISSFTNLFCEFSYYRAEHLNTHMLHNLYANSALVLGFVSLIRRDMPAWKKWLMGVLMAIVCLLIFLSDGRIGTATMLLLVALMICYSIWYRSRKWGLVLFAVLTAMGVALMCNYSRISVRTGHQDPRFSIWPVAIETISEHPIMGYGPDKGRSSFIEKGCAYPPFVENYYNIFRYRFDSPTRMHCHNAFLDIWIDLGVVGVILLALIFALPILLTRGRTRYAQLLLSLVFVSQCMFDVLGGDIPPILYMVVLILLLHGTENTTAEVSVPAPDHAELG